MNSMSTLQLVGSESWKECGRAGTCTEGRVLTCRNLPSLRRLCSSSGQQADPDQRLPRTEPRSEVAAANLCNLQETLCMCIQERTGKPDSWQAQSQAAPVQKGGPALCLRCGHREVLAAQRAGPVPCTHVYLFIMTSFPGIHHPGPCWSWNREVGSLSLHLAGKLRRQASAPWNCCSVLPSLLKMKTQHNGSCTRVWPKTEK